MHHDLHKVKMHLLYPHSCCCSSFRFECVFVFKLISFYVRRAHTLTQQSRESTVRECKSGNLIVHCFLFNSIECRHKAIMPRVCVCVFTLDAICFCVHMWVFSGLFVSVFLSFFLSFIIRFLISPPQPMPPHMYAPYKWSIGVYTKREPLKSETFVSTTTTLCMHGF